MKNTAKYVARLFDEWKQHGKIIVAIDFDDTISPWKFNSEDEQAQFKDLIRLLREVRMTGAYLVIFTSCNADRHQDILNYCLSKDLEIDAINETPVDLPYGKNGAKIYANIFLDDRGGLDQAVEILADSMYRMRSWKVSQFKLDDVA